MPTATRRWTRQRKRGLEGIVAKRIDSPYEVGRRSGVGASLKYRPQQEFVVGGWVPGSGNREHTMGAYSVGVYEKAEAAVRGAWLRHGVQGA